MRTGTASLQVALEKLLDTPCYNMGSVALEFQEPCIRKWLDILENDGDGIDEALKGFESAVDYPACCFYQDLLKANSDAKVCAYLIKYLLCEISNLTIS